MDYPILRTTFNERFRRQDHILERIIERLKEGKESFSIEATL